MNASQILEDLFQKLGVNGMPEAMREQLVESVIRQIHMGVNLRAAEQLKTEEQAKHFSKLIELEDNGDDGHKAAAEIRKLVPNYDEIVAQVTQQVSDRILALSPKK